MRDMNTDRFAFNRRAVKPMVCLSEGWQLIKDDYWLFLGITFVGALLGGMAPLGILQGPAMCGIYLCLLTRLLNLPVSFNTLFKGFDYFLQSFIATLIMIAVAMVFMVPLMIVYFIAFFSLIAAQAPQARNAPPNEEFLWSFVSLYAVFIPTTMVISMAIHALFLFTYPLTVDRELTGVEAVKLSMRAAFGNFFGVAGLILLTVVLSLLGVMAATSGPSFSCRSTSPCWRWPTVKCFPRPTRSQIGCVSSTLRTTSRWNPNRRSPARPGSSRSGP